MTDDQLETLLARQGEAWRAAQPAAPSLSAMTGTPPARAPWLLPALVAAALVVPVVGTVTLLQRHDPAVHQIAAPPSTPSAPVVVPWADLPATAPVRPAPPSSGVGAGDVPPAALKQCEAGDFAGDPAVPIQPPAAVPRSIGGYLLTVRRVGSGPCGIGALTPTMDVLDAAGQRLGIGRSSDLVGYSGYELLAPGDLLQVRTRICGSGIASLTLQLAALPDRSGRTGLLAGPRVSIPFSGESTCASGTSLLSHQRVLAAGSLATLVPTFSVPGRVRSGQPLDYSVTLTNPTSVVVSLDPCPSYRQSLIDVLKLPDRHGVTDTGRLNCAAAPASVPAHGSITFRLRLETVGVPAGDRRLVWDWLGSTATDAQGYAQFPTVTAY